jgi:hypothetical protein
MESIARIEGNLVRHVMRFVKAISRASAIAAIGLIVPMTVAVASDGPNLPRRVVFGAGVDVSPKGSRSHWSFRRAPPKMRGFVSAT